MIGGITLKKSILAVAAAAAMAISSVGTVPAYAASVFADINNLPWAGAATYIEEAYNQGLMAGYVENGKRYCKAKNNVTYNEAVQLMYSIMSSYKGTTVSSSVVSKWTNTMAANNIPSWAYNAVAYALENSILSKNDLRIFMANASTQNNARREDVAVIFGKALATVYSLSSNPTISYGDSSSVSTTSVPYLELLNRLNIMVGDSNNKFNPKAAINRAEMAVLVSKTYNTLKGNGTSTPTNPGQTGQVVQYSGTIKSKTSTTGGYTISVSGKANGVSITYTFTTNSATTVISGSSTTTVDKLKTGDAIVAVCNGSVASTILLTASGSSTTAAETKSGTISGMTSSTISIKSGSSSKTYDVEDTSSTKVTIDGSNSTYASLKNKFNGGNDYTVKLSLNSNGEVIQIVAESGKSSGNEVKSITSRKLTLTNGKSYGYVDDDELVVKLVSGTSTKTLDDIDDLVEKFDDMKSSEKMTVALTLDKHDDIEKIVATISSKSSSSSGKTISSVDRDKAYIKIGSDKYHFPDDDDDVKTMKFDGDTYERIDKFLKALENALDDDETLKADITMDDDDEYIYKITVTIGSSSSDASGTLKSIDTDDRTIKIGSKTYDYTKSTDFSITDGEDEIDDDDDLYDAIKKDDKTIEIELTIKNKEVTKVEGYVKSVKADIDKFEYNKTDSKCYVVLDNSSSAEYKFTSKTKFSGDCEDTRDIRDAYDDGKTIEATLTLDKDGKITNIKTRY